MFQKQDQSRNECMLTGGQARCGYDWWWHSFTARHAVTGEEKPFFIEFFLCNPKLGGKKPILGQLPENQEKGIKPSYLMVKAGAWGKDARQLHRFFGWGEIEVTWGTPFGVKAEECYLDETKTYGHITISEEEAKAHPEYMCEAGEMSWIWKSINRLHLTLDRLHYRESYYLRSGMKEKRLNSTFQNLGHLQEHFLIVKRQIRRLFGMWSKRHGVIRWSQTSLVKRKICCW